MKDQSSQPFLMSIESFYPHPLRGRKLMARGRIESGAIRLGDFVEVVGQ